MITILNFTIGTLTMGFHWEVWALGYCSWVQAMVLHGSPPSWPVCRPHTIPTA